jgi:hypothetical protein
MRKEFLTLGLPVIISLFLFLGKYLAWFGSILNPSFVYIFIITILSFFLLLDGLVKRRSNTLSISQNVSHVIMLLAIPIHLICIYGIYYYSTNNQYYIKNDTAEAVELIDIIGCDRKNIDWTLSPGETKRILIEANDNCRNLLTYKKSGEKVSLVLPTPKGNSKNRISQKIK